MMIIAGTVPVEDMPLTFGPIHREGDSIVVAGRRIPGTQGTGAMASAALATTAYLKLKPPVTLVK